MTIQSNLAAVLRDLGKLEEVEQLLRAALASEQKNFEPGHPTIAVVQSNLALVLKDLGKQEEAGDRFRAARPQLEELRARVIRRLLSIDQSGSGLGTGTGKGGIGRICSCSFRLGDGGGVDAHR